MGIDDLQRGLDALRRALAEVLETGFDPAPIPVTIDGRPRRTDAPYDVPWLLTQTSQPPAATAIPGGTGRDDDSALATSSLEDEAEGSRLIALVELARSGDSEAFGQLYDHYHASVYRFLYYRVELGTARRGPHRRDLLPRPALDELLPLAGQGLRGMADDHRPQPDH